MNTSTPSTHQRSPLGRRLLAASAAVVVAGVTVAAWAGVSAANTRPTSHPAVPSTLPPRGGGSVSPAVPSRPTVDPAVPSMPSNVPTIDPATPSQPPLIATDQTTPSPTPGAGPQATPSPAGSVQVLRSYSKGAFSIQMTITNSTNQVWTFDSKDSFVSSFGHWGQRSPQTVSPGQDVTVTGYTDSPTDSLGFVIMVTYTIPDGHYATFWTLTGIGPNSATGEWATSVDTQDPDQNNKVITACPAATTNVSGGVHPTSTIALAACTAA
jgi:septal ring-binding cell division protein DamX